MPHSPNYILFICGHNAGRSQMGQAFFNHLKVDYPFVAAHYEAISCGTEPGPRLNPEVVEAMQELGIDMSDPSIYFPKPIKHTDIVSRSAAIKRVILVCDNKCLLPPGITAPTQRWNLTDPYKQPLEVVRQIRDATKEKVIHFLEELESNKQ